MPSNENIGNEVNGTSNGKLDYSVPEQTSFLFGEAILEDARIAKDLPVEITSAAAKVRFTGSPDPSIPVNWKFAEAAACLKGLEAALVNVLLSQKYGIDHQEVTVDTDHATLFIISPWLWSIDLGEHYLDLSSGLRADPDPKFLELFPNGDINRAYATPHRNAATGIYQCADGKYFLLHGSLNPDPTLESVGLPHDMEAETMEEAIANVQQAVSKIPSGEMDELCNDVYRQAGSICYTVDEYNNSEHGQANKHVGLWEIYDQPSTQQQPCWWPEISSTSVQRPLAGLKVVDLTRIIAAPTVTRGLAELGASVMRCTSPNVADMTVLHPDLNWGKWNCRIDLKEEGDREKLKELIMEADVVVQGYRPGALDKYGFSQQAIIDMCKHRERGIISVRENCYGWHGPNADRSGWQQVSDSSVGVSLGFGKAMGVDEGVLPIFPHSDYCTGSVGTSAILVTLLRRAENGGSYAIDLALDYYTAWLVRSIGEYPPAVWDKVWDEHDRKVWHNYDSSAVTAGTTMKQLRAGPGGERLFKPEFFEQRSAPGILGDTPFNHVKSIAQWPSGTVDAGFRIGTRGNGADFARWPEDLDVECVTWDT